MRGAFLVAMLSALAINGTYPGMAHADSLPTKKITSGSAAWLALTNYCCVVDIPCSIELDTRDSGIDESQYVANAESYVDEPANEVLPKLMARYPNHQWAFKNGVLYISPIHAVADNPIEQRTGKISAKNARIDYLFSEILTRAYKDGIRNISTVGKASIGYPMPPHKRVTYVSANPSFREFFDSLTHEYRHAAWYARYTISPLTGKTEAKVDLLTYDNSTCSLPSESRSRK